jgi:hypothetical protein
MRRDGLSEEEADVMIEEARDDFHKRIEQGDPSAHDICEEYFGLEPDYIMDLM